MAASFPTAISNALAKVKALTTGNQSAVNWASNVVDMLDKAFGTGTPFGSAATKDTGTTNGKVPLLNTDGELDVGRIPTITADMVDEAATNDPSGVTKIVTATAGEIASGFIPADVQVQLAASPTLRTYSANGTWSKPNGLRAVFIVCVARGQDGTNASRYYVTGPMNNQIAKYPRGTGGMAGRVTTAFIPAGSLTASVAVAVSSTADGKHASSFGFVRARGYENNPAQNNGYDGFVYSSSIGGSVSGGDGADNTSGDNYPLGGVSPEPPGSWKLGGDGGTGYGAGGGGAGMVSPSQTTLSGGSGATGVVLVWEVY